SNHDFSFIPYDGSQLVKVTLTFDGEESITVYDSANGINSSITTRGALNTDDKFVHMIANLTEDCTIEAVFTNLPEYTLHVIKKGEGEGTFTYEGTSYKDSFDVTVKHGSTPELTIKAKGGSKIVSVMVGDSEETAVKVDFSGSVLTLPEVTKDIYVIAEFEKIPSGGGPQTGDTVIAGTVTNLFIISALVCVYCVFRRRKSEETA
ncbi:MAG: hypothetical protein IJP10_04755, partial [Clostridia bacterium]|nr:hypothetical protein [Clostridia bacterium]